MEPLEDDWDRRGYDAKDWTFNFLLLYSVVVTVMLVWRWI